MVREEPPQSLRFAGLPGTECSASLLQAERFWTFDQRQLDLAKAEGMGAT